MLTSHLTGISQVIQTLMNLSLQMLGLLLELQVVKKQSNIILNNLKKPHTELSAPQIDRVL